jgi:hypothetical protein
MFSLISVILPSLFLLFSALVLFHVFITSLFGVFSYERLKSSTKVDDETSSMITLTFMS